MSPAPAATPPREVLWHDLECGSYHADLGYWQELAAAAGAPGQAARVLDLGCGTGRVVLALAASGHDVTGLDRDRGLLAELSRRAAARGLSVATIAADARDFELDAGFDLVLAPMQLVQLVRGSRERRALISRARAHLRPGGLFACALLDLEGEPTDGAFDPPLPDMREQAGWVFASQPVAIHVLDRGRAISLNRVRRAVSPRGDVEEELSEVRLELVSPDSVEHEARAEGFSPRARHVIPADDRYVGSIVVSARRLPA